ncbi:MAG: hypothetical protein ACQEP9_03985 [Bacillota bacterium]
MSRALYNRNCSKEQLIELLRKFKFDYFITLGPNINLLGRIENFNWGYLEKRINHIHQLEDEYSLKRVRFFASDKQLEWKKRGSEYHLVIIEETEKLKELAEFKTVEITESAEKKNTDKIYLWGELDTDQYQQEKPYWYEEKVPRLFDYPLELAQIEQVVSEESPDGIRAFLKVKYYEIADNNLSGRLVHYQGIGCTKID